MTNKLFWGKKDIFLLINGADDNMKMDSNGNGGLWPIKSRNTFLQSVIADIDYAGKLIPFQGTVTLPIHRIDRNFKAMMAKFSGHDILVVVTLFYICFVNGCFVWGFGLMIPQLIQTYDTTALAVSFLWTIQILLNHMLCKYEYQ